MSNGEESPISDLNTPQNDQVLASREKDEETDEQLSPAATFLLVLSLTVRTPLIERIKQVGSLTF